MVTQQKFILAFLILWVIQIVQMSLACPHCLLATLMPARQKLTTGKQMATGEYQLIFRLAQGANIFLLYQ